MSFPRKKKLTWGLHPKKLFLFSSLKAFGHAGKRLDKKAKVNFEINDITDRNTSFIYHPISQDTKGTKQ